jgi:hypothetical protein
MWRLISCLIVAAGCGRIGFGGDGVVGDDDGDRYQLTLTRVTRDEAAAACAAAGAHLATIADADENARVFAIAATIPIEPGDTTKNHRKLMWLDGVASAQVGDPASWAWDTGEPMTYANWRSAPPEPSNDAAEHCMIMLGADGGAWDNRSCTEEQFAYLCERD